MLHLEPTKRLPLAKVLEHKWMQGVESDNTLTNQLRVFGSNDHLIWNDQVLLAIQRMNYSVEASKQVHYHGNPAARNGKGPLSRGGGYMCGEQFHAYM